MPQHLAGISPKGEAAVLEGLCFLRDYFGISKGLPGRREVATHLHTAPFFSRTEVRDYIQSPQGRQCVFSLILSLQLFVLCIISTPLTPSPTARITPYERVL